MIDISMFAQEVHAVSREHGWWDKQRSMPELLCLVHSEVSEALEAYRSYNAELFDEEIADIIIRVLDICEHEKIDIEKALILKNNKNKKRPYRHGDKRC